MRVGERLSWAADAAPRGELVLLRDHVDVGSAFLVHHFLSLLAKAGTRPPGWSQLSDNMATNTRLQGIVWCS